MKNVSLNEIRIDGGTQGRTVIDQQTVYQYVDCMKDGDVFPPLETVFDGTTHWLVDGFHRYHAYKILGAKKVEVQYKPGTQEEAQVISFGVNGKHGKPRTNDDKNKIVLAALEHPMLKDKTNYEIAKVCAVSQPFVAGLRDPEKKEKQAKQKEQHIQKKAKEIVEQSGQDTNPISSDQGLGPDADELKANELAMQADMETMYKLLDSDDALAEAHEEIKRLNHQNAQLEIRLHGLMNEKNAAIKMVKDLQKQLEKLKAQK
jgi:hypothetical protein